LFVLKTKSCILLLFVGLYILKTQKNFNFKLVQEVKDHGIKYKATTYFAGVGFANAKDYDLPLTQSDKYAVNFDGLQIIE
jgi:hypothetical protein